MNHSNQIDICPMQLAGILSTPLRRILHRPERILAGLLQPGQIAADFGCGPGYFTLELARQVGPKGKVFAVDLQTGMLDIVRDKAQAAGLQNRIIFHKAEPTRIGLDQLMDFGLAFWMVHEVPDRKTFLVEVAGLLKPGGRFLVVEPRLHVSRVNFIETVALAELAGLKQVKKLGVTISQAILFEKG